MGLSSQNVSIVPTPSGILDGHFPDGNDGTAGIPLTWTTVPSFLQKQVGTAFSVNVFTLYLTQPGGATASISVGALSGGWTLSGAGLLAYSGVGQGTGTVRVRATLGGNTSDSNLFTFESIATIVSADTLPPTSVTGLASPSKTTTTIVMNSDVPSDSPTALIPASGLKEVRWFKGGIIDGVTSYGPGLTLRLTKLDVATSSGRKWFPGSYTAISNSQKNAAGGLPNPNNTWDTGPVSQYTSGILMRWQWNGMESGAAGGVYDFSSIKNALKQCRVRGVALFAMIETRTFGGDTVNFTAAVTGTTGTLTASIANGSYSFVFGQNVEKKNATVTGGVNVTWSGALSGSYNSAIANNFIDNPMPDYLSQYAEGYISGIPSANAKGGWQGWRWNTTVTDRFQKFCAALGATDAGDSAYPGVTIDAHPYFGGLATQETSNGNPTDPAYNTTVYTTALKSEMTSIGTGCPSCRQIFFLNFGISIAQGKDCAAWGWQYGMILAGPDLVMQNGGITSNVYPTYTLYHNGTAGAAQGGPGPTGCSIQPAEWAGTAPGDHRTIPELYNFGLGLLANDAGGTPLKLDIVIPDWHTAAGTSWNGATFANDGNVANTSAIYAMSQHPVPFGTYTAGTGMTTGSVTQNNNNYDVTSYGLGIGASSDQWTAANGSVNGDVTVICKLTGLDSAVDTTNASMGVCIRDASGPTARAVYLTATATQLRSRYRISPSGTITNLVDTAAQGFGVTKWVKIVRATNLWSFFYSTDGITWTAVGTVTIAMVPTVYVQLFGANFAGTGSVTAHFQQVNIQQLAKINYTFTGLTTGTPYTLTAVARDLANNDSVVSTAVVITTN